jgi:hypothetical protein
MNTRLFNVGACIAWAAVAMSSAAPASALAVTTQVGSFASCSANSSSLSRGFCFDTDQKMNQVYTSYTQTIKLVSQGCSAGGCQADASTVYTDFIYPVGRKTATDATVNYCGFGGSNRYYELSSCAC